MARALAGPSGWQGPPKSVCGPGTEGTADIEHVKVRHVAYEAVLLAHAKRSEVCSGRVEVAWKTRRQGDKKMGCAVARYRNMALTVLVGRPYMVHPIFCHN